MALALCAMLLAACSREPGPATAPRASHADAPSTAAPAAAARTSADTQGGAVSAAGGNSTPTASRVLEGSHWPQAKVGEGQAAIGCSTDYDAGDGEPLADLGYFEVLDAMAPCRETGLVRLHYRGKIDAGFADLVERVGAMAGRMGIGKRILDLDSPGGQVEAGIRAGDAIGDAHWTIWVREGAVCHSACVLVLAAGDNRLVSGKVGVHRMIRIGSTASTREQLNGELRQVQTQLGDYLQRNGASAGVAELMMTIPSRELRLLTPDELQAFGLSGTNAVQDDLERIRLRRKCGDAFVARREAFQRAFDQQCNTPGDDVAAMTDCGRGLRDRFGFPGRTCADESPLAEYDLVPSKPAKQAATTDAPDDAASMPATAASKRE